MSRLLLAAFGALTSLVSAEIKAGPGRDCLEVIDNAIEEHSTSDLGFLKTLTHAWGLSEKQHRLKSSPTDQPVMYAPARLVL